MARSRLATLVIATAVVLVGTGLAFAAFFTGRPAAAAVALIAATVAFFLSLERRSALGAQVLDEFESQFME